MPIERHEEERDIRSVLGCLAHEPDKVVRNDRDDLGRIVREPELPEGYRAERLR